jgi:biopolymer transport protein ExbD
MLSTLRCRNTRYDSGPNLTPLVDVVMVVLIFLMLAGSFGSATHFLGGVRTSVRGAPAAQPRAAAALPPMTLDLFLSESQGALVIDGKEVQTTSDPAALQRQLRLKSDGFIAGGIAPARVTVVLHPDRGVRYGQLMAVCDAVASARFTTVAMAASR